MADRGHVPSDPCARILGVRADEFSLCMGSPTRQGTLVMGAIDDDQHQYYTGGFQTVSAQSTGYFGIPVTGVNVKGNMFNQSSMPDNPWGKVRQNPKTTKNIGSVIRLASP